MDNPTLEEIEKFSSSIYEIVSTTDYNYIEAVVHYCEKNNIELEVAATLIDQNLKSKIENLAVDLHYLKDRGSRLPL